MIDADILRSPSIASLVVAFITLGVSQGACKVLMAPTEGELVWIDLSRGGWFLHWF